MYRHFKNTAIRFGADPIVNLGISHPVITTAMILQLLFLLSLLPAFTQGLDITGSISLNSHLLSPASLPPSTLLILSSANLEYKTHPSAAGSFKFRNITAGPSYILQIECLTHSFPLFVSMHKMTMWKSTRHSQETHGVIEGHS